MTDSQPNPEILARLEEELTPDLVARATVYADQKCKWRRWYGLSIGPGAPMAGGHTPEDIVQTAIVRTIDAAARGPGKHRRVWDGERPLFDHLTSVIDSEISNLTNSWINRSVRRGSQMSRVSDEGQEEEFFDTVAAKNDLTPAEVVLSQEAEQHAEEFLFGFVDSLDGDELLTSIVELIVDGVRRPREIAAELGVPVTEIYSARKRLNRRLAAFRESRLGEKEVDSG